jgi:catalase
MTEAQAAAAPFNPFDVTKVWPHADFPLVEVGVLELNLNPDNYFAEVEQASFSPSNVVPGISFSPDKMLQARIFAYADAHRYRVGTHYEKLPVNQPLHPARNYYADGPMRFDAPLQTDAYYEPNSFGGPGEAPAFADPPLALHGDAARYDHRHGADDFGQARALFLLMSPAQQAQLFDNLAAAMSTVPNFIQRRQIDLFHRVDPAYGVGVAARLGVAAQSADA